MVGSLVVAAKTQMPVVALGSSAVPTTMPVIAFGTAAGNLQPNFLKPNALKTAVVEAIKLGYRHFDTASIYGSEQTLGEAIKEALSLGLVASRDQLFITSKLWSNDAHPHLVIPALKKSLENLQLEHLDLYLIHWPISAKPGKLVYPLVDLMPLDFKGVWAAMEESLRLGLTKSIGVSNFSTKKIETLLSFATIPPLVNQVEMSPFWHQKKLRDFCKANGIVVTAYSPLGAMGTSWGTNHVMESQVLQDIAEARGKTLAQVCIRWVFQVGATLAVKSYNKERLKQNLQVFDWELTEDDLDKINQIPQHKMLASEELVSADGSSSPYKSVEELWDGPI